MQVPTAPMHNMTCDLTAQIRSRISASPSSRVISKPSFKSNLSRVRLESMS